MTKEKNVGMLSAYCKMKGITIYKLSQITGVNRSHLALIDSDPNYDVKVGTVQKIYSGTTREFGRGLSPQSYLSQETYTFLLSR